MSLFCVLRTNGPLGRADTCFYTPNLPREGAHSTASGATLKSDPVLGGKRRPNSSLASRAAHHKAGLPSLLLQLQCEGSRHQRCDQEIFR